MSAGAISAAFSGVRGGFSLDVAFEAPMRGVTALFGPSGSGKTTILRCMAGLERLSGRLSVGDELWQDSAARMFREPHRRPVGYVFQEPSLFPHLSVRENLVYGARRAARQDGANPITEGDIVDLLGIGHLLGRGPLALSGGERQRVSVGRALLSQPRVLLMDEPLAALDRAAKEEILPYFEALHQHLAIPILYVSHDIAEVERLADRLVLLEAGRVIASGPLSELEADPKLPLLGAADAAVMLEGSVVAVDPAYALTSFSVPGGTLIVPGMHGGAGDRRRLRISAADVSFALAPALNSTILNVFPARILSISPHARSDAQVNIVAALGEDGGGARIVGRITRKSQDVLGLAAGALVFAQIKGVALLATG
jgi:molybdate transport system ATP-binding protein